MADIADLAQQEYEQMWRQINAERIRRLSLVGTESAKTCENCGKNIPEKRRKAVPGCTRCTTCQENID